MTKYLSKEALLIKKTLLEKGLENPLTNNNKKISNIERKKLLSYYIIKIMKLLNLDLEDPSISKTPNRIVNMYIDEIFSGLDYFNFPKINLIENKNKLNEIITIKKIHLYSTCEHHFISIDGFATISYIPENKIIGLSKINRIVSFFSSRPQLQERLTKQILVSLQTLLETKNVAISINAIHHCVKSRGIKDLNSMTNTTLLDGLFKSNKNINQEFLLISNSC